MPACDAACPQGARTTEIVQSWLEMHLKQREQGINTLVSFFFPPSSLAESARSHLIEELRKCSLAHKVSPSVLENKGGQEQVTGPKENGLKTGGTSVGMVCDHCLITPSPRLPR